MFDQKPEDGQEKDPQFAYTLAKGLAVLRAFEGRDATLSNAAIADATGISRPTVARLTRTLCQLGYLRYDAYTATYRIAVGILRLINPFLNTLTVRQICRPLMQRLADYSSGAVSIGMRDGLDIVLIECCVNAEASSWRPDIGASRALPITAFGRAYFAAASTQERAEIVGLIKADTRYPAKILEQMEQEVRRYNKDGFCVAKDLARRGIHAVAVPFRVGVDSNLFVINCAVASYDLKEGQLEEDIAPRLRNLVRSIEQAVGPNKS